MCTFIIYSVVQQQEIARHLRPSTLRAKYGHNKLKNAVHCTDLADDGMQEVSGALSYAGMVSCRYGVMLVCCHAGMVSCWSRVMLVWSGQGFPQIGRPQNSP